ncbi:hypothetical protein CR513_62247, partial [Mucuna pruriens]
MANAKPMNTLMVIGLKLTVEAYIQVFENLYLYKFIIGRSQYATVTILEISYAVNKVALIAK